jgi:Dolichyl-phosphate-mannose-protein mannosyltransferase
MQAMNLVRRNWKNWQTLSSQDKSRRVLLVVAAAISGYLLFAPKPWNVDSPTGITVPYDYYVKVCSWWGGLVALGGSVFLLASSRWWTRPYLPAGAEPPPAATPSWFWPLVAIAMLLTAAMGSLRLGHDLWDDEDQTLRRFVQGSYRPVQGSSDGAVEFREFGAGRTIHFYTPNNHNFYSIAARISVETWKALFRSPAGQPFSEAALRFPALLFGVASVAALAMLLKELGLARAGVFAAFLLSAHPWHVRYASEARGYCVVLCVLPLLILFWLRAIRTGRWAWWGAMGAAEFALLYTYPVMIFSVGLINLLTAGLLILALARGKAGAITLSWRWLVASIVSALALVWIFLPCIPQFQAYLAGERAQGTMGPWWLKEFFSCLFSGVSWAKSGDLLAPHPELRNFAATSPLLFKALLGTTILLLLAGMIRWLAMGKKTSAVGILLLLPGMLAYWMASFGGSFLHEWYLIYVLPGTLAAIATGLDSAGLAIGNHRWSKVVASVFLVCYLAAYVSLSRPAYEWLLTKPLQPMRASVLLTRETTLPNYPGHGKVVTASFNTPALLYDPHMVKVTDADQLRTLMAQCEETGQPLFLNVGNPWAAAHLHPELWRMMTDSPQFEVVAQLPGFDPTLDRIVARYVPGSRPADQPGR